MSGFAVGPHRIGPGEPCFFIAEAGVNHDGNLDQARAFIDVAAQAGADAVKFQTFDPALLASQQAPLAAYQRTHCNPPASQRQMLERLSLPRPAYRELLAHAQRRSLLFLSSPFDEGSADFLAELDLPAFKIPSGEITNHPFLVHLARLGRPLLLSTGMCTLGEVAAALTVIREAGDPPVALFHCVSSYPCPADRANLRAMETLRATFGRPTGWSDHTLGQEVALAAVALGANLLEKHFTLDRALPGPDHAASLEPTELAALVRGIRAVESALGDGRKVPDPCERDTAQVARKSLFWKTSLPAGALAGPEDFVALRPGTGVSPAELARLAGRRLRCPVVAGGPVELEHLGDPG